MRTVLSRSALAGLLASCLFLVSPGELRAEGLRDLVGRSVAVEAVALDGDTLLVVGLPAGMEGAAMTPGKTRIRLWGVDAPEHDAALGPAALYALDDLLASAPAAQSGAALVTCRVLDIDRYKRLIATCTAAPGFGLAERLLGWGLATAYRAFTWADPAHRDLARRYDRLQAEARAARRGLWADTLP